MRQRLQPEFKLPDGLNFDVVEFHPVTARAGGLEPAHAAAEARAIQSTFARKRSYALQRLREMGLSHAAPTGGAFHLFVDLGQLPATLRNGMDFFRACLDARVICVPGVFFDVDPGKRREHLPSRLQHFVRLSFGPSMPELKEGLDRIETLIHAHRS